ncbi:alpha/beta fold hydrolase [Propionicicella superfundia]|uniref:alpha/beta fold hydrolase n=1 Tax=Propionicicella superfundia TaxID=348582 RepID=UPI00041666F0|nr:alpha/beta fold hydrolase [Propionicicella superfundia]
MTDRLAHRILGDPPADIVFCHGLLGRGANLTTIAKGLLPHSSLLLDLPNHGRSGWTSAFDYLDMADAVAAEITRSCDAPVTLVGHSMGGKVAMLTALGHPDTVARLCVIDISPRASDVRPRFEPLLTALRAMDLTTLRDRADADARLARAVPDAATRAFLLQNLQHSGSGWRWQPNLDLLADELPAIGGWPELGLPPNTCPVTWIRGERSPYVSDQDLPVMRDCFPNVRLLTVPGAGHWVHADAPQVVVQAIADLLAEPVEDLSRP